MPKSDMADLMRRFHQAVLTNHQAALRETLSPAAEWHLTGRSALAGSYHGPDAIIELVDRMHSLSGGTLRAFREDSWDVCTSEHHAVLMDRYLARRDGRSLDSHEAIIAHAGGDGRLETIVHYFFDQYAFDEFWG